MLNSSLMTGSLLEATDRISTLKAGLTQELLVDVIQLMAMSVVSNTEQRSMTSALPQYRQFLDRLLRVVIQIVPLLL